MARPDDEWVQDILDNIHLIQSYLKGMDRAAFDADSRYPRAAFVGAKKDVDTGFRRHDGGAAPTGQPFWPLVYPSPDEICDAANERKVRCTTETGRRGEEYQERALFFFSPSPRLCGENPFFLLLNTRIPPQRRFISAP
jgi:hypothetical protein